MYSGLISFSEGGIIKGKTKVVPRPYLILKRIKEGIQIDVDMEGKESVLIYSKRGDESTYSFLAEINSGFYVDERPNLTKYSEVREYKAFFGVAGAPFGEADFVSIKTKGRFRIF